MKGKKTGGREKGTPNVSTKIWRDIIGGLLYDDKDELKRRLSLLNDKQYVNAYISMLRFVCPQLSSISINDEDGGNDFMKKLRELSKEAESKEKSS